MLRFVLAVFLSAHTCLWTNAVELNVFAAASLTDVLTEIGHEYEQQSHDKAVFNFAASSVLARQIEEGAPADVYFSADEEKMENLEKKGLIKKGSRRDLLSNSLVVVVAKESSISIKKPEDLKKARRIAIAEPRTVPAGIYARKYLEQVGLWELVKQSIIPTENVRGALSAVGSGNVDAGIVYKTDVAISKRVKVVYEVPANNVPRIVYPVGIIQNSKGGERATKFLEYLCSDACTKIFEKWGFIVLKREVSE
jgi:molybdate transport system substrate-binding protein